MPGVFELILIASILLALLLPVGIAVVFGIWFLLVKPKKAAKSEPKSNSVATSSQPEIKNEN